MQKQAGKRTTVVFYHTCQRIIDIFDMLYINQRYCILNSVFNEVIWIISNITLKMQVIQLSWPLCFALQNRSTNLHHIYSSKLLLGLVPYLVINHQVGQQVLLCQNIHGRVLLVFSHWQTDRCLSSFLLMTLSPGH